MREKSVLQFKKGKKMGWNKFQELSKNCSGQFQKEGNELYYLPLKGDRLRILIRQYAVIAYVFVGRMDGGSWEQISSSELEETLKE